MRHRITVRGEGVELRGYIDADHLYQVERLFADDLDERAILVVSPAEDDYDPFKEAELRELHHFETEQENAKLRAITNQVVLDVIDGKIPPVKREADLPHEYESESDAAEGGVGPCTVCGNPRGALIHG